MRLPRLPQRTLAGPGFDSLVHPRGKVPQFRLLLAAATLLISVASLGWAAWLPLLIIGAGYLLSHLSDGLPLPAEQPNFRYALRTLIATFSIGLVLFAAVAPQLNSGVYTGLHPEFLLILWIIPLLTILGSERLEDYLLTSAVCALAAGVYIQIWAAAWPAALTAAATILLVALIIWQLYISYQNKVKDTEEFWQKIADYDQTKTLRGISEVLTRAAPQAILYIHSPTQLDWQRYNPVQDRLEKIGQARILERVLQVRQPHWLAQDETLKIARPNVLIPIPYAPGLQPPPRLRAVVQIPTETPGPWSGLLSGRLAGGRQDSLPNNYRVIAEALDHALDNWKTDRAREAFAQASEQMQQLYTPADAARVAAKVSEYFECPVAIWLAEADDWRCVAIFPPEALADVFPAGPSENPSFLLRMEEAPADRVAINRLSPLDAVEQKLLERGYTHLVPCQAIANQEALAALALVTTRAPHLKPRELRFLQSITSHLGFAFSHIRDLENYESMARVGVKSVTEIIQNLTQSGETAGAADDLQRIVGEQARRLMHADSVVLYGLEPSANDVENVTIVLPSAVGDIKNRRLVEQSPLKPNSAVYWLAKHWKEPVLAENTLQTFYGGRTESADGTKVFPVREGIQSTCAAALHFNEKLIGVIFVNYHQRQVFRPATRQIFEMVISLAAHSLAISGFYQEWAAQTAYRERRRLRARAHSHLKGIAQTMTLELDLLQRLAPDPTNLPVIQDQLRALYTQSRQMSQIAQEFMDRIDVPEWTELYYLGLAETLQNNARYLITEGQYTFQSTYESNLLLTQEKSILDFAVEAILNTIRYAFGSQVMIRLDWDQVEVILTVSDNGPGIPDETLAEMRQNRFKALREAAAGNPYTIRNCVGRTGLEVMLRIKPPSY